MLGKITDNLLNECIKELKKDENQAKIRTNILDPLVDYILWKLYPHILLLFILIIILITLIFRSNYYLKI